MLARWYKWWAVSTGRTVRLPTARFECRSRESQEPLYEHENSDRSVIAWRGRLAGGWVQLREPASGSTRSNGSTGSDVDDAAVGSPGQHQRRDGVDCRSC